MCLVIDNRKLYPDLFGCIYGRPMFEDGSNSFSLHFDNLASNV